MTGKKLIHAVTILLITICSNSNAQNSVSKPENTKPAYQVIKQDIADISGKTAEELATHFIALAPDDTDFDKAAVLALANGLIKALSGKTITNSKDVDWIAGDLDQAFDPGKTGGENIKSAISDIGSGLKKVGVSNEMAEKVKDDLKVIFKKQLEVTTHVGPVHSFRYNLKKTPKVDKTIMVEDFEFKGEAYNNGWYQPNWSTGIVLKYDSATNFSNTRYITISNDQPLDKYNGFAKIPKTNINIKGTNAIRMNIQPFGNDSLGGTGLKKGSVTIGFIDGSEEIWQMEIPGLLEGTEPYILEVRLEDFTKTLRRNNGVIDMEIHNCGFWMGGTYKFSVDNICFVHNPAFDDFPLK